MATFPTSACASARETDDNIIILHPRAAGPADEARIVNDTRVDRHTALVTFFPNKQAATQQAQQMTLPQLAEKIGGAVGCEKFELPWLKLARFGDIRSDKNCLRTNINTRTISGCEVEHDAGSITFEAAVATMKAAGIRCLIYTSPSWKKGEKERWRILLPTRQELPPARRAHLVARVHGLLGEGTITGECFTLSQAYLYGHLKGADHHEVVLDGDFIDECEDLDAGALGKLVLEKGSKYIKCENYSSDPHVSPCRSDEEIFELLPHSILIDKHGNKQWHNVMLSATASMIGRGWSDAQIYEATAPYCDAGWGDPDIEVMVNGGREKWGTPEPIDPAEFAASMREMLAVINAQQVATETHETEGLKRATEIWDQCWALQGTLAERYLKARGIEVSEDAGEILGFHEACPWQGGRVPALVAVMSDGVVGSDNLAGIQVTALSADGGRLGCETIGGSGAIMLAPFEAIGTELAITVGIETALSAHRLKVPVWALPDVEALAAFPVLPCLPGAVALAPQLADIEQLTIIVSRGMEEVPKAAISHVRTRWEECGLKVRIVWLRGRA